MAHKITEDCISCGACEAECPVEAISPGDDKYEIDPEKCTDCGACEGVCPVGIPMRQFTKKLNKDALELFSWEAGLDPEQRPPLDLYRPDDYNDFIKQIFITKLRKHERGTPVNKIANAIEEVARADEFTIVKNLCSHGVGKSLHAFPENINNYYDPEETLVLKEGMVIAWEPYISSCAVRAIESGDQWNLTTHNKSHVAQFEHTILITSDKPEILTII